MSREGERRERNHNTCSASQGIKLQNSHPQSKPPVKFCTLSKPMAPFPIAAWSWVLEFVDQSPTCHVSEGHSPVLYLLPDPIHFCSDSPKVWAKTGLLMQENWLFLLMLKSSMALSKQSWQDLLAMNPSSDWWSKQGSEAEMKQHQRIHDLLAPQHIDNVFLLVFKPKAWLGCQWSGRDRSMRQERNLF